MPWWAYLIIGIVAIVAWDFRRFSRKKEQEEAATTSELPRSRQFGKQIGSPTGILAVSGESGSQVQMPTLELPALTEAAEKPDWLDTTHFEDEIVSLIQQSRIQQAEQLTLEAIARFGSQRLKDKSILSTEAVAIEGWEEVHADLLEANAALQDHHGQPASALSIRLVNRPDQLLLERTFFVAIEKSVGGTPAPLRDAGEWNPRPERSKTITVIGLDGLARIQRARLSANEETPSFRDQRTVDASLAGLLLLIRYHDVVERRLRDLGLPQSMTAFVGVDRGEWPARHFFHEYCSVLQVAQTEQAQTLANETLRKREEEIRAWVQAEFATVLAEYRETYRLLRCFPFYRGAQRKKIGDMLTHLLQGWCRSHDLPSDGVSWKMSEAKFERFLRLIAEARNVPSVEDALDVRHVNALHEQWVEMARQKNFEFDDRPISMFALNLTWSLKFGGPIVQDRWAHLKGYKLPA